MENTQRECLFCGQPLRGRTDKKFCNDACRNGYNNEHNSDANNWVRNINNTLRKNRRILKSYIPEDAETGRVTRAVLAQKGYKFKYQTHVFENKKGQTYTFCYEYGFLPTDNEWLLVVKQNLSEKGKKRGKPV